MLKNQRLSLALALALGSQQALALGLGSIEVKSQLNQPLVAEIPILSSRPDETKDLRVSLASPDAFAKIGIDLPAVISANLQFAVEKNGAGQTIIRITTPGKVKDPFLNFLIQVESGHGQLLREYTVLLDPPVLSPVRQSPAVQTAATRAPAATVSTPAPQPPVAVTPLAAPPPMTPAATPVAPVAAAPRPAVPTPLRLGPVTNGQTLWAVAQEIRDPSLSTNQIMLALLKANPEAFIGQNINRLKTGAVLRIPSAEEFRALGVAEADAQVRSQNGDWRAQSTLQPLRPNDSTAAVERPTRAAPADSRLEVVPPAGDTAASNAQSGAAAAEGSEVRADLTRAREQVTVLEQENTELRSRVSDLEKIDRDTRRIIELKDSELADAQRQLAELQALRDAETEAESASAAIAPPIDESAPIDLTDASTTEDASTTPPSDEGVVDEALVDEGLLDQGLVDQGLLDQGLDATPGEGLASDGDSTVDAGLVDQPAEPVSSAVPMDAPASEPAPTATPWYLNPMYIGGAGALLVGLFALLAMRGRKKPAPPRRGGVAEAYAAATAGAAARLAEQEVAAAGKIEQEQLLLDDIAEQPDDLSRHLALVSHYYDTADASGFEGAAEAMYAQLYDPEDSAWKEVLAMGREMLPDHPLFAVAESDGESFSASLQSLQHDDQGHAAEPMDAALSAAGSAQEIDWALPDSRSSAAQAGHASDVRHADLGEADPDLEMELELDIEPESAFGSHAQLEPESMSLDADTTQAFSIDELERMAQSQGAAHAEPQDSFGLDLDAEPDPLPTNLGDDDDAAATKLELARAYLDMGDVEGARGMLEEVVAEGNAGQRSEAKRLIDEIR